MRQLLLLMASGLGLAMSGYAGPIRNTPGLTNIIIYEMTGTLSTYTFVPAISGPLETNTSFDFQTGAGENFDIYFSNADGTLNVNGEYLTASCLYSGNGSGCNIAAVGIDTSGGIILANSLTRFVTAPGYISGSELLAVDSNINTAASMGSSATNRMEFTFAFPAPTTQTPEPATYGLIGLALAGGAYLRRKR